MGEQGECLGLIVLLRLFRQPLLSGWIATQKQDGRLTKGPAQISIADLGAAGAIGLAGRFPLAFDQAAIGDEVLHAFKAFDAVDFVEDDQRQDIANALDGLEPDDGIFIDRFGGLF